MNSKKLILLSAILALLLMPAANITAQTKNAEHIIVYHEVGKFTGWPANNGACTSMWLLLHDDLADPNATDPILRQSTRVCAAAVYAGQTSIDPPVINEWIPSTDPMHRMIPYAVGQQSMANVWPHAHYESKYKATYQEFSPINHLDANDPPLYMEYNRGMKLPAANAGDAIHHPMFGIKMWEKSNTKAAGHECHLRITSTNEYKSTTTASYANGVDFLIDKLLAPVSAKPEK